MKTNVPMEEKKEHHQWSSSPGVGFIPECLKCGVSAESAEADKPCPSASPETLRTGEQTSQDDPFHLIDWLDLEIENAKARLRDVVKRGRKDVRDKSPYMEGMFVGYETALKNVQAEIKKRVQGSEVHAPSKHSDAERLDWLDEQREPISYDSGQTLHSYAWAIEAQNFSIRDAIDAARHVALISSPTTRPEAGKEKKNLYE